MRLAQSFSFLVISLATLCFCADQDILTILRQQDSLAAFTTYLELFPDLIDQLNDDTFTVCSQNTRGIY